MQNNLSILYLIEKYFPNDQFTANELSIKTGINSKVCSMVLKRLANSYRIGYSAAYNFYYYWSVEQCNIKRNKANDIIEKYNLKQKKFKII
jgi:hypothetical protein